jgi:hypothetical protein
MFNTLKKVLNQIISDFYKIDIFRFSIVYIRFLFLFYILNKKKVLFNEKDDAENIITFKEKKKDNFSKEREKIQETTLEHNLIYTKNIFNLKRKYNQFLGKKTKSLISQMESLDFINKENAKILSIGPRNEGELYLIRSFGYKWSNIFAIDLQTYTNKIELNDMHNINYEDNFFDIIISGWTLAYSKNKKKALNEIKRVAKKNAIISIGYTYLPENLKYEVKETDERLTSNSKILSFFEVKNENIFFNFDSILFNIDQTRHSILTFRLSK